MSRRERCALSYGAGDSLSTAHSHSPTSTLTSSVDHTNVTHECGDRGEKHVVIRHSWLHESTTTIEQRHHHNSRHHTTHTTHTANAGCISLSATNDTVKHRGRKKIANLTSGDKGLKVENGYEDTK
jgi:hypothetical protein